MARTLSHAKPSKAVPSLCTPVGGPRAFKMTANPAAVALAWLTSSQLSPVCLGTQLTKATNLHRCCRMILHHPSQTHAGYELPVTGATCQRLNAARKPQLVLAVSTMARLVLTAPRNELENPEGSAKNSRLGMATVSMLQPRRLRALGRRAMGRCIRRPTAGM